MKKILVFLTIGISTLSIAQPLGVTPRKSAQDYPSVQTQGDLTLGVVQLSQKQVRKQFVSNLGKKYVVVEVGAYPKTEAKLSRLDFSLREAGSTKAILPADPAMSAELREKGLPEVTTKTPVAGYLYFPVSSDKPLAYELVYQSDNGKTVVPLIMPSK